MLKIILAAFSGQSLQRVLALPAEFWTKVKVRCRHNPGFVAAAAAGSIGLVLALVLGIQGAMRLLDEPPPGDGLADDSPVAAPDDPADDWKNDLRGQLAESMRGSEEGLFGGSSDSLRGGLQQEPDVDADEPDEVAPARSVAKAGETSIEKRNPFEMDDEPEAGDTPVSIQPRNHHPLTENPLADDEEPPRKTAQLPVDVDDEPRTAAGDADDEPAKIAAMPSDEQPPGSKPSSGPSFSGEEPDAVDSDAEGEPSESAPVANDKEALGPGWKYQRSKPLPAAEAPAAVAQKSQAVETVIYATPAAGAPPSADDTSATEENAEPSRLILEVAGPRSVRAGQACNFEIRVKNPGRTPAEKITLSVELPTELVHEVAQVLEQKVAAIGPGQTYRALLRMRAKTAGKATLKADVAIDERTDAKASATINIGPGAGPTRAPHR